MKFIKVAVVLVLIVTSLGCSKQVEVHTKVEFSKVIEREFYQLRTYMLKNENQVKAMDNYLGKAFLPALKKINISNVGVFKPIEEDSVKKLYVLIPFKSIDQFIDLESELSKDLEYIKSSSDFVNAAFDQPNYERMNSVLLKAFIDFPKMKSPEFDSSKSDRVYELRSYESATEKLYRSKVDMFNAGGEVKLFDKLAFNAVFYGEVISGAKMPNLMYMTTFSNMESRDVHWDAFRESPEWKELKVIPKYKKTVSHSDIMLLQPTEYSDY